MILNPDHWDRWMTIDLVLAHELQGLLAPAINGTIYKTAVNTRANSERNDDKSCLASVA